MRFTRLRSTGERGLVVGRATSMALFVALESDRAKPAYYWTISEADLLPVQTDRRRQWQQRLLSAVNQTDD